MIRSIDSRLVDENTIAYQREYWGSLLIPEILAAGFKKLGFAWGDPESECATDQQGRELGNYAIVLRRLKLLMHSGDVADVVEVGSYGGKWTQYIHYLARHMWCVDLFIESKTALLFRFGRMPDMSFYLTPGYDLAAIPDASVDLVFSMDSLVRAPIDAIGSYLSEFYRVLRPGGHVLVHLPWDDSPGSRERNFTRLNRKWLLAHISQFSRADLDDTTLKHGLLLHLTK